MAAPKNYRVLVRCYLQGKDEKPLLREPGDVLPILKDEVEALEKLDGPQRVEPVNG